MEYELWPSKESHVTSHTQSYIKALLWAFDTWANQSFALNVPLQTTWFETVRRTKRKPPRQCPHSHKNHNHKNPLNRMNYQNMLLTRLSLWNRHNLDLWRRIRHGNRHRNYNGQEKDNKTRMPRELWHWKPQPLQTETSDRIPDHIWSAHLNKFVKAMRSSCSVCQRLIRQLKSGNMYYQARGFWLQHVYGDYSPALALQQRQGKCGVD